METIKLNITIDKDWLEATWIKEVTTINDVEKEVEVAGELVKEIVQEESVTIKQIHCESFSGHPEHIAMLEAKAVEFGTSLDEYAELIIQAKEAFVLPTEEEIEAEKRKQFEIQFRYNRDLLLKQVDIALYKAEDSGISTTSLRVYRQALRDATIDWIIPESVM